MSSDPRSIPPTAPVAPSRLTVEAGGQERFTAAPPCALSELAPYCERVKEIVSPDRFAHIMRVTTLATAIARAGGFTENEVRATALAAILHDAARDLPIEKLFALAPPEIDLEREHPLSVHGRAGRALAKCWGVSDERVLEAISGHICGVPVTNSIGMAVYVADVSEPGRGVNADIRELAMRDLLHAYERAVGSKVSYLQSKGKTVHPLTLEVYEQICRNT